MQLRLSTLLALVPALTTSLAASVPLRRQDVVAAHGSISLPGTYDAIAPGATFNFGFDSVNYCESGYEPVTIWLLETPPTVEDMTTNGTFATGTYLFEFGEWLVPNFGLPEQDPPPPPSSLAMPDFSTQEYGSLFFSNATFYLTVVETYLDCPGNVPKEYGITSTPIIYNATSSL